MISFVLHNLCVVRRKCSLFVKINNVSINLISSLNVKQIMRKSFKICSDVFNNPHLLSNLYDEVAATLSSTYPELVSNKSSAKLIIEHEAQAYAKMRAGLAKKWKDLVTRYPEVESLNDVETPGFALGYKEFKEVNFLIFDLP